MYKILTQNSILFQLSHHHPPNLVVGSLMSLIQFISFGFNKSLVVKLHEYLLATCGCEWVGISVGQFSLLLLLLLLQRKNPKQREPSGEVMNPKQREPSGWGLGIYGPLTGVSWINQRTGWDPWLVVYP